MKRAIITGLIISTLMMTACSQNKPATTTTAAETEAQTSVAETVAESADETVAESADEPSSETTQIAENPITLTLSDLNAETSQPGLWCQRIKELVEAEDVNVTIEYYPNGSLTGQDIEACQAGICDMLQATASTAAGLWSPLGAFDAPYIFDTDEQAMKVFDYNSAAVTFANENIAPLGIRLLGAYYSGSRELSTTDRKVQSVEDLKGAKIRVVNGDLYLELFRAFGAEPTPMAFSELSTALVTGVCEGQENPYSAWVTAKFYEIQKYGAETGHMPANYCMWINENSFKKLSEKQQQVVINAVQQASKERTQFIMDKLSNDKKTCIDAGMEILDESNGLDVESFKSAAMTVYETFKDAWGEMPEIIRSCY